MTFAAPLWLWLGGLVAAGVVALHFLARRTPRPALLPTARFVPLRAVRWPSLARRPSDLVLLLVRVAAVLLIGLAFARPVMDRARPVRRVVLADRSAAVADTAELRDAIAAWMRPGDTLVVDSSGSLSTGLVRALRAARTLRGRADSLELVIVSPFVAASVDAATPAIRAEWRGGARLVPMTPAFAAQVGVEAALDPDDPLAAAVALAGLAAPHGSRVRLTRDVPAPRDSAFARAGGTVVTWPVGGPTRDTVLGVAAGDVAIVARFPRRAPAPGGRVVAQWVDGTPAAAEWPVGAGCVREVAVTLPAAGDLPLRPATQRFARRMLAECDGPRDLAPIGADARALLAGPEELLATRALPEPARRRVPAHPWLLAAALVVFAFEPIARRRRA